MSRNKKIIWTVVALVVAVGLFYGGVAYGKSHATTASAGGFSRTGAAAGAGRRTGATAGGAAGGNALIGSIISKDQNSITVGLTAGGSNIVIVPDSASVLESVQGNISDLSVGQLVVVQGTANSDGSYTATTIQVRPGTTTPATTGSTPATPTSY